MKKSILIILFFLSLTSYSQKILVLDAHTKNAISNVSIAYGSSLIVTNMEGTGEITGDTSSLFVFKHTGYKTKILKFHDLKENEFIIHLERELYEVKPITIAANRWEQDLREVPVKITVLAIKDLTFDNPQTAADLLSKSNEIFVQKSQLGGGSPMIRGFAANRILIVIDGVRMNNAIYRSGNLQNVISIDPNNLSQAEVIYGPGSVIYGSDAIGGVMDFHTKTPRLSHNKKLKYSVNSLIRYSTANQEKTGHFDFSLGLKKIAVLSSLSYSQFDNLMMGTNHNPDYVRNEYVEIIDQKDSIVSNPNINEQMFSAFNQINFLQKVRFKPNAKLDFNYTFHYSTTSDIPRYDRLIQYDDEKLKYAKWYYGPQKWSMHHLKIAHSQKNAIYDKASVIIAYQNYSESRHDRKRDKDELRSRYENVKIGSANIDLEKKIGTKNSVYYGFEFLYNLIGSKGDITNIFNSEIEPYASRYPDGSTYSSYSTYMQFKSKINKHWTFNAGIRFNQVMLRAKFDTTFYNFPFEEITNTPRALSGSVGIVYKTNNDWYFNLNGATGFRAPNIDDIGKVFDSEPGNVIVPNPDLEPEYIYSTEISIYKNSKHFSFEIVGFYSFLNNAMIRSDYTFNGQDSIMYDGVLSKVEAFANKDQAIIYGCQLALELKFLKYIHLKTNYNYTTGYDMEKLPLRHVPPQFGATHLIFKSKKIKIDLYTLYNSEISYENLSESERDKAYIYSADNDENPYSPAWWTLNFKMGYSYKNNLKINFGIENILDYRYRPYSSGIVAPGRNFIFSIAGNI